MGKKLTTSRFIEKAKKKHGDLYNYLEVNYKGWNKDIKILCKRHGEFSQRPNNHLNGHGCPKCSNNTLSKQEFFKLCKIKHNNKYYYFNKTLDNSPQNMGVRIKIKCPKHGIFYQLSYNHKKGSGCPSCATLSRKEKYVLDTKDIKRKLDLIHNNKFIYIFKKRNLLTSKIIVICPEHGEFKKSIEYLLNGSDCRKCVGTYTTKDFIKKSIKIHENRFDYSKTEYTNCETKVSIICKNHGIFLQIPHVHMRGMGCPSCSISKNEEVIFNFLKENNILFEKEKRFKECKDKKPLPFDFYLPYFNLCIEYDGEGHYQIIRRGKQPMVEAEKGFLNIQSHDKIKNKFCKTNNIKLLRIPYWEKDNIINILKKELML